MDDAPWPPKAAGALRLSESCPAGAACYYDPRTGDRWYLTLSQLSKIGALFGEESVRTFGTRVTYDGTSASDALVKEMLAKEEE